VPLRVLGLLVAGAALFASVAAAAPPKDHDLIRPYPGSVASRRDDEGFREYRVVMRVDPTGKTDDDALVTRAAEGALTRLAYENPEGKSIGEIHANYREGLAKAGFEILFSCTGQDCGPSWASSRWARVTGMKYFAADMGYLSARLARAEGDVYVAVAINGARHQIDVLETRPMETGLVIVTPEALERGLAADGRVVLDGIRFDHDKAEIRPESAEALAVVAGFLAGHASLNAFIVGHTDTDGTFEYNQDLSRRRAAAVVEALITRHGIAKERLTAHGVGPLCPSATNRSGEGQARNRRVEMVER